jgi:7-carboxy-7-deazaguanine synthase
LLDPQRLAEWILDDNLPIRLGLQIHKLIWDPALKGV